MNNEEVLAERLDSFLTGHGLTRQDLLASLDEPFGRPLLVVATGSVLQGVGNRRSDLDVNVVVEGEVTRLPIAAYTHRLFVDTTYFGAAEVANWAHGIRDFSWPPPGPLGREQWYRRIAELFNCTRFGSGLALSALDDWNEWLAEFRQPWLSSQVAHWWQTESIRRWLAARWLADLKPLLAAQRLLSALLAAFESRAAEAGEFYFAPKWLSEKLRCLGDTAGLATMRALMHAPISEREVPRYLDRCEAALEATGRNDHRGLAAQLFYVAGVKVRRHEPRTLVSRWNLRGIDIAGGVQAFPEPPKLLWEGELDDPPPRDVLTLFAGDMTWLSIVSKTG